MTPFLIFLSALLARVSPDILRALKPILVSASKQLWKAAYPVAINIVKDLADNGKLDGLDKHKAAVQELEKQMIATGKFTADEIKKAHLGMIVLTAFVNTIEQKP